MNPRSTAPTNPASDIPPSLPHLTSHQNCPPARCVCLSVSLSQPRCLSQSPPSVPSQPKHIPPEHTPHLVPYEPPIHSLCQSFFFLREGIFLSADDGYGSCEVGAHGSEHRIASHRRRFAPFLTLVAGLTTVGVRVMLGEVGWPRQIGRWVAWSGNWELGSDPRMNAFGRRQRWRMSWGCARYLTSIPTYRPYLCAWGLGEVGR